MKLIDRYKLINLKSIIEINYYPITGSFK